MQTQCCCPKCNSLVWTPDFEEDGYGGIVNCINCKSDFNLIVHVQLTITEIEVSEIDAPGNAQQKI